MYRHSIPESLQPIKSNFPGFFLQYGESFTVTWVAPCYWACRSHMLANSRIYN